MPEHNSQQLLYAAVNTGQLALAEQQTQMAVDFPKQYGPSIMADGEGPGGAAAAAAAVQDVRRWMHCC